jgi:hypothetical protein
MTHFGRRAAAFAAALLLTAAWPLMLAPTPAAAADFTFQAVAQAPVFQITEDHASASFHPEGDGDYNYAEADLGSQGGHALAAVVWPGAAGGHAGSLVQLLGGPSQAEALNDPAKAEAGTGSGEESSCCPAGVGKQTTASVKPPGPTADTNVTGGGIGGGSSVGNSASHAQVTMDANNVLNAVASSAASGINIADVFKVGSVTSSATATSVDGATPKLAGATVYNDVKVAGQEAYVDGSGVHVGKPGKPAGSETLGLVNRALKNFGMTIYYTDSTTITIGSTQYFYAGSVIVFWQPPQSGETFTVSIGGAAVGMAITPGSAISPLVDLPAAPDVPASPAAPTASLPTDAGTSAGVTPSPAPAVVPGTISQPITRPVSAVDPLAAVKTHGIGAGPIIVLGLLGVAAAFAGPRLPGLLSAAWKPGCELERLRQAQLRSRQ